MKDKKILWVGIGLLGVLGLGFLGYLLLMKPGTKSSDPEKNNRNIILKKA